MKIEWNKVTWYSKLVAVIVFLATFMIAFYLGRAYQAGTDAEDFPILPGYECTTEAKLCPDGTAVGRTGPSCEFRACPGE